MSGNIWGTVLNIWYNIGVWASGLLREGLQYHSNTVHSLLSTWRGGPRNGCVKEGSECQQALEAVGAREQWPPGIEAVTIVHTYLHGRASPRSCGRSSKQIPHE